MKRQEQKRRLRIARETLRVISREELSAIAGGGRTGHNEMPKSNAWTGDPIEGTDNLCSY